MLDWTCVFHFGAGVHEIFPDVLIDSPPIQGSESGGWQGMKLASSALDVNLGAWQNISDRTIVVYEVANCRPYNVKSRLEIPEMRWNRAVLHFSEVVSQPEFYLKIPWSFELELWLPNFKETLPFNPQVVGSIPTGPTKLVLFLVRPWELSLSDSETLTCHRPSHSFGEKVSGLISTRSTTRNQNLRSATAGNTSIKQRIRSIFPFIEIKYINKRITQTNIDFHEAQISFLYRHTK